MSRRLIVLRALGVGDLLTAVPALRALASAFDDHHRVLLAPAMLRPLVGLLDGVVDEVLDTDFRHRVGVLPAETSGADVAVNLHGQGPESSAALAAAHPERLVAFAHPDVPVTTSGPPWRSWEHEVRRWCRLLSDSDVPADPTDIYLDVPTDNVPGAARGATLVHPGAATGARRWPAPRFATVAAAEAHAGRRVLVTGAPDEMPLADEVAARAGLPGDAVLAGRTSLLELAGLVAAAGRVVTNDTGVAHLAVATRTPSVVVFGPTDPRVWGPVVDADRHLVVWAGEFGNGLAERPSRGLLRVDVPDVLAALARLPQPART